MIGLLLASSVCGQTQAPSTSEYSSLFVVVTPSQFLTRQRVVGQKTINDTVGRRNVSGRGITTAKIQIESVPSPNSAKLRLKLDGHSDGESVTSFRKRNVISNDLTRFHVDQVFELTNNGLNALEPKIQVQTHRKLNRVDSDRVIGRSVERTMASSAFLFKNAIDRQASQFSERKLRQELARHEKTLDEAFDRVKTVASRRQLSDSFFPEWRAAHVSSDDRVWRFKAGRVTSADKPPPLYVLPVSVRTHKNPINDQLQRDFGGKTFTSGELEDLRNNIGNKFQLPALKEADEKPWSITFRDQAPLLVEFDENSILVSLSGEKFVSGDKTTAALTIKLRYRLQFDGQWLGIRDARIEVETGSDGQLGGRQQVIKTVMRRRFERLFPEKVTFGEFEFAGIDRSSENSGRTLEFKTVAARDGWISFGLGHKN